MTTIKSASIMNAYKKLVNKLLTKGENIRNTLELRNCVINITNPNLNHIWFPYKSVSWDYSIGELKWYWSGKNDLATISQYSKFWNHVSDDGQTVNSAYGYILLKKCKNQIAEIIKLLKNNLGTRKAILYIGDPTIDKQTTKDLQCTIAIQFLMNYNGKLEETVYMRSNDVNFGFPYDYIYFITLGLYIANEIGAKLSNYFHVATSLHMYLKDRIMFEENVANNYQSEKDKYTNKQYLKLIKECLENDK